MHYFIYLLILILLPATAVAQSSNTCVFCHAALEEEAMATPVPEWRESVHEAAGITCQECHGGTATSMVKEVAHDVEAGYRGALSPEIYHEVCGTCHQMQMTNYLDSPHGLEGGLWPSCIDCHDSHAVAHPVVAEISVPEKCEDCHENATLDRFVTVVGSVLDPIAEARLAAAELKPTGVPVDQILAQVDQIKNSYSERASHVFLFDTIIPKADSLKIALNDVDKDILAVREEVGTRRRFGWLLAIFCVVMAGFLWLYRRSLPDEKG